MLGHEHGMPPVGGLLAVVSRRRRGQPRVDELLRMAAHGLHAPELDQRPLAAAQVKPCPEALPADRLEPLVNVLAHSVIVRLRPRG